MINKKYLSLVILILLIFWVFAVLNIFQNTNTIDADIQENEQKKRWYIKSNWKVNFVSPINNTNLELQQVDYNSFTEIKNVSDVNNMCFYWCDTSKCFVNGKIIREAEVSSFTILWDCLSKDISSIYFVDQILGPSEEKLTKILDDSKWWGSWRKGKSYIYYLIYWLHNLTLEFNSEELLFSWTDYLSYLAYKKPYQHAESIDANALWFLTVDNKLFHMWKEVNADLENIQFLWDIYLHDWNNVFHGSNIIEWLNASLSALTVSWVYLITNNWIYRWNQLITSETDKFKTLWNWWYAKDSQNIFFQWKKVSNADYDSFFVIPLEEVLQDRAKDKSNLFIWSEIDQGCTKLWKKSHSDYANFCEYLESFLVGYQ